jgi:DNA repair protein RAD50
MFSNFPRRNLERAKQHLMNDRERQRETVRTIENNVHSMELKERDLKTEIREKTALEERVESMKKDIITFNSRLKVVTPPNIWH